MTTEYSIGEKRRYWGIRYDGTGNRDFPRSGEPQWRDSLIGRLNLDTDFHFEPLDATDRVCGTVTGFDNNRAHTFRLWIRGGQMELYVEELLMQSFFIERSTGRFGFLAPESQAQFSNLKFYEINFDNWQK